MSLSQLLDSAIVKQPEATYKEQGGSIPRLYLQKQAANGFGPRAIVCNPLI